MLYRISCQAATEVTYNQGRINPKFLAVKKIWGQQVFITPHLPAFLPLYYWVGGKIEWKGLFFAIAAWLHLEGCNNVFHYCGILVNKNSWEGIMGLDVLPPAHLGQVRLIDRYTSAGRGKIFPFSSPSSSSSESPSSLSSSTWSTSANFRLLWRHWRSSRRRTP